MQTLGHYIWKEEIILLAFFLLLVRALENYWVPKRKEILVVKYLPLSLQSSMSQDHISATNEGLHKWKCLLKTHTKEKEVTLSGACRSMSYLWFIPRKNRLFIVETILFCVLKAGCSLLSSLASLQGPCLRVAAWYHNSMGYTLTALLMQPKILQQNKQGPVQSLSANRCHCCISYVALWFWQMLSNLAVLGKVCMHVAFPFICFFIRKLLHMPKSKQTGASAG